MIEKEKKTKLTNVKNFVPNRKNHEIYFSNKSRSSNTHEQILSFLNLLT